MSNAKSNLFWHLTLSIWHLRLCDDPAHDARAGIPGGIALVVVPALMDHDRRTVGAGDAVRPRLVRDATGRQRYSPSTAARDHTTRLRHHARTRHHQSRPGDHCA